MSSRHRRLSGAPRRALDRRGFFTVVSGALAPLGCDGVTAPSSRLPGAPQSSDGNSQSHVHELQAADATRDAFSESSPARELERRFIAAHDELRGRVAGVLEAGAHDDDRLLRLRAVEYVDRLLRHHRAEDVFIFPAFRAANRLRSSDVAFLDARDAEHRDVHRLCIELRRASLASDGGASMSAGRRHILQLASELDSLTRPHFHIEEATFSAAHLSHLLRAREIIALFEDMRAHWNSR